MLSRICLCALIAVLTLQAQGRGRGGVNPGANTVLGGISSLPPPPPPSDCAVSGTVVNAITGEPIPRATVTLGGFDAAGSTTDAKGEWSIANTSCANRVVNATRIGFVNSQTTQNNSGSRPTMVNLVSGSPVTSVKISLMPESSIAGKVLDPASDPIESARVQVMRVQVQNGQRMVINAGNGLTDSEGNFRIGGMQPGRYVVCASSPQRTYPVGGGPPMVYRDECYPGPIASALSIAMPLEAGREIRTSFTLTPFTGVHVRGHIAGNLARGSVQLVRNERSMGAAQNFEAQLRNDGTFDIQSVLPGSYLVIAFWPSSTPGGPQGTARVPVEVGNSDVEDVNVQTQPGGSLSGTVRYEFSNPMTMPGPRVNVNLRPAANGGPILGRIPQAEWDSAHQSFTFADLQPNDQFQLNANVNGQGVYVKSATLRGQDILNHPFTVQGAAGPADVVVSDDTGGIDITVNDSDGHPAIDAGVLLQSASGLRRIMRSGDDGHAKQQNLPTGDYRVWAWDNIQSVPYAEEDWMNQNAGSGEKISITSGGAGNVTVKRQTAPTQ